MAGLPVILASPSAPELEPPPRLARGGGIRGPQHDDARQRPQERQVLNLSGRPGGRCRERCPDDPKDHPLPDPLRLRAALALRECSHLRELVLCELASWVDPERRLELAKRISESAGLHEG